MWWKLLIAIGLSLGWSCGGEDKPKPASVEIIGARKMGEPCKRPSECKRGLTCLEGVCGPDDAVGLEEDLEEAYEMGEDRTDNAINRYDPSRRER